MANGFQGFQGFGEATPDLSTSEGLLNLAGQQGGAVAQVANELAHPTTGILSTVGNKFKNAFKDFIDVISVPNQVIAGAISSKYTVKEAVEKNISASDVIYGKPDPKASIYQKVGGFVVRTATDVLLDPTTYLTFGTGAIFGSGLKQTVVLGEQAAKAVGKETFETAVLSKNGVEVFQHIAKLGRQIDGTAAYKNVLAGKPVFDMAEKELRATLRETADATLDPDFARNVMSKLLEKHPALAGDFLDKGGIKYFGQTILSAQRLKHTMEMIPGMSSLDVITDQPRKAIASLFSPNYTKLDSGAWVRVPKGITEMAQKSKDLLLARQDKKMLELSDVVKTFDLGDTEARFLMASIENSMVPSSPKLQAAYKHMLGYSEEDWVQLVDNGFLSKETKLESFAPHILVDTPPTSVSFKMPPSAKTGATKERKMAKFVNSATGQVQVGHTKDLGLTRVLTSDEQDKIIESINRVYEKTQSNVAKANDEIAKLAATVQQVYKGKMSEAVKARLKGVKGADKKVFKQFIDNVVGEAGELNVVKLSKGYAEETLEAGVKKAGTVPTPRMKKPDTQWPEKESTAQFVEGLKAAFIENPTGARKALESILGKKQQIVDMLNDLDLTVQGAKLDLAGIPAAKAVYKNAAGDILTKETAPIFSVQNSEMLEAIEDTLLKDPKAAAKMLDDIKQDGFEIFDDNLVTAWAARSLKDNKAITMKSFLKDVARNFGVEADSASPGFVKISSEGVNKEAQLLLSTMGKEGEMVYHPAVASYIEKFASSVVGDDATMDFLKSYDKLQSFWKSSVTSVWPAFHGRNAISNVLQNYLDIGLSAMDPRTHTMSMSLIQSQRAMAKLQREAIGGSIKAQEKVAELASKKFFTDVTGAEWSYGEIIQVAKNNNIAFTSKIVSASDAAGGPEGLRDALFASKTVSGKVGRALATPGRIGQDVVGRTIEEQSRLVNFLTNLKNTGDVTMASRQTKQFLFDYSNLTNFERNVLRRIIPFYTFTRKNLELQARALINTPGRIAAEVHAFNTLGEVISGGQQLTDEERAKLPDWVTSGMTILTKKNGSQVNILRNLGTPLEAPFQLLRSNMLLGSVSPLLRVPVELGAGYNFFAGKALSEVTNASSFQHAPQVIKNMIGFTTITTEDGTKWNVALRPTMMHLILNLPPTPRVWSTLGTLENQDLSTQEKTVASLIGTKISSFDLEEEEAKKEKELKRQLEDLLTRAKVTAKFTRTFVPKKDETISGFESF